MSPTEQNLGAGPAEQKPDSVPAKQKLNALGAFKDWSNYLLVTTVAALGWVAGADTDKPLTLAANVLTFLGHGLNG